MKFLTNFLARKRVEAATDLERYQQLIRKAFTDGDLNEREGEELIAVGSRVGKSTEAIEAEIVRATAFNENVANYRRHIASEAKSYREESDKWNRVANDARQAIEKANMQLREADKANAQLKNQRNEIANQQSQFAKLISDHRDLMPNVSQTDTALCHHSICWGDKKQSTVPESFDRLAQLGGIPQNFGEDEHDDAGDFPPPAYEPLTLPADLPAEARAQWMDTSNTNGITVKTGAATVRTIGSVGQ